MSLKKLRGLLRLCESSMHTSHSPSPRSGESLSLELVCRGGGGELAATDGHGLQKAAVWGRRGNTTGSSACATVAMKHPGAVSEFVRSFTRNTESFRSNLHVPPFGDNSFIKVPAEVISSVLGGTDHSGKALLVHMCLVVLLLVSFRGETTFVGFSFFGENLIFKLVS